MLVNSELCCCQHLNCSLTPPDYKRILLVQNLTDSVQQNRNKKTFSSKKKESKNKKKQAKNHGKASKSNESQQKE